MVYILYFSTMGNQSSLRYSHRLHFILTTTLEGKLGWVGATGPKLASEWSFRQESGVSGLDLLDPRVRF